MALDATSVTYRLTGAALFAAFLATPVVAQDRDFCPDRPGLGTPACTLEKGRVAVEVGIADWSRDENSAERDTTLTLGSTLLRYGIADHAEIQLGWDGIGIDHYRDKLTGFKEDQTATGDLTVALRRNLLNPDGSGVSLALMPYATLPVGGDPISAGDWGAGLIVPASFELSEGVGLSLTTQIDAAVNEDGEGRHFAVGEVVGFSFPLTDALSGTLEYNILLDQAEEEHTTQHIAGASFGWMLGDDLQLDLGANAGLNEQAPDIELYFGAAMRF